MQEHVYLYVALQQPSLPAFKRHVTVYFHFGNAQVIRKALGMKAFLEALK
jgi:hypothetical protein